MQTLTDQQANALMHWIRTDQTSRRRWLHKHRDYLIASLMLDAGLRVSEVTNLRRDQLIRNDQPLQLLEIASAKRDPPTTRYIPVAFRLALALEQYPFDDSHPTDTPAITISPRQIENIIKTAGHYALNIDIHPHMLRHTFATRLMRTSSIRVVQDLLGHKSLQSTQIYTHPDAQDLKTAIDSLNPHPNPERFIV